MQEASIIGTLCLIWLIIMCIRLFIRLITGAVKIHTFNNYQRQDFSNERPPSQTEFLESLLGLFACVMKADGVVLKSELYVVKQYLRNNLSEDDVLIALGRLKELLNTDFRIETEAVEWAQTIRRCTNSDVRSNILFTLFEIAMVDGTTSAQEREVIYNIGSVMGFNPMMIQMLEQMIAQIYGRQQYSTGGNYSQNGNGGYGNATRPSQGAALATAFSTMGLSPDADEETIKKTYRKLAATYHPDRYATESEEKQKEATQKFQAIQEAYDYIKAARGIK